MLNRLILASSSPRRQYLMKEAGLSFQVEKPEADESFPPDLPVAEVARYLALKKAENFRPRIHDEIIVTADTVVILQDKILNKPQHREEAVKMLHQLSGQTHSVVTGVSLVSKEREESFDETTEVTFRTLSLPEIEFYVDHYKPFDKAGAYGAQECLPAGMNPCSPEEIEFLRSIQNTDLIEKSKNTKEGSALVAIAKISGSYFNVMGLPIHKVYAHLKAWL